MSTRSAVVSVRMFMFAAVVGLCTVSTAQAWNVTFTRNPRAQHSSASYNLVVKLQQQGAGQVGQCLINWDDPDDACTIAGFPTTTNALVSVYHRFNPFGGQRDTIGEISFWISVSQDMTVHIPTGDVKFTTDKTGGELVAMSEIALAILPQSDVEMGESFSNRPNSLTDFFGLTFSNCGWSELASGGSGCYVSFLAGCYAPVFARPRAGASKTKIWVNQGDSGTADHVLCIKDGETVNYVIKVQ